MKNYIALSFVSVWVSASVQAAPVVVFRDEFAALQAGRQVVVEDFQGFGTLGPQVSPVPLANGVFTSPLPSLNEIGSTGVREIFNRNSPNQIELFTEFPASTIAWGTAIYGAHFFSVRHYDIIVESNSGILELSNYGSQQFDILSDDAAFFGVFDPEGLISVRFQAREIDAIHGFSDITTVSVPEPATFALAGTALLAGIGFRCSRRFRR